MEQRRKLWGEAREGREKEDKENLKVIGQVSHLYISVRCHMGLSTGDKEASKVRSLLL